MPVQPFQSYYHDKNIQIHQQQQIQLWKETIHDHQSKHNSQNYKEINIKNYT